jgi:DNA-binding NtrC family response regulator
MRELRNALEHAVILADGDTIEVEHLPGSMQRGGAPREEETPAEEEAATRRRRRTAGRRARDGERPVTA